MQIGFLQRTPRGRMVTPLAYRHLGLPIPQENAASADAGEAEEEGGGFV